LSSEVTQSRKINKIEPTLQETSQLINDNNTFTNEQKFTKSFKSSTNMYKHCAYQHFRIFRNLNFLTSEAEFAKYSLKNESYKLESAIKRGELKAKIKK
jgi:hypothetical protein